MKATQRILSVVVAALISFSTLYAQSTITQTKSYSAFTNYSHNHTFNQFNPQLGTLTSIEVILQINTQGGSIIIDNDGGSAASGNADFGSSVQINSPTHMLGLLGQVQAFVTSAYNLDADDGDGGVFSATGTDATTILGGNQSAQNSGFVSAPDFPFYQGTGTFNVQAQVSSYQNYFIAGGAQAQISPPTAENTVTIIYTYTPASVDLAINKIVNIPNPTLNTNVTYTITLQNQTATQAATNIKVEDILPAGLLYVSSTPSVGTYNSGTGIWDLGTHYLTGGSSQTLTIVAQAISAGNWDNIAQVNSVDQPDPDSTPDNDIPAEDDQDNIQISVTAPEADLELTKIVNNATPNLGDVIQYTVTLTNNGPFAASNIIISDLLPSGVAYVSHSASSGSYNTGTGQWSISNLGNGSSATLQINVNVTGTGTIINVAEVISADQNDTDSPHNNNILAEDDQDDATITVPLVSDLSLTKTVDNNTPTAGTNVTFTITVTNDGPDAATNVVVTDLLPGIFTPIINVTESQGTYNTGTGIWTVGSIANGASAILTIEVTFTGGTATNIAEITTSDNDDPDSTPNNNVLPEDDEDAVLVTNQNADISINKVVSNILPNDGETITYTITATNNGPNNTTNLEITDQLPAGVLYVSDNPSQGTYNSVTGVWSVGSLANGLTATLELTGTVSLGTCAQIDLGPAEGYNVFVFEDLSQPSADTQGKMAVGGNAYLSAYSVGDKLPASGGTVDVLIVDGDLLFVSGDIWGGNVVYGNSTNLPTSTVSIRDGSVIKGNPINFTAAYTYLSNLSNTLSSYTQNGTVDYVSGVMTLTGTHPYLNVFNVSGTDFSNANSRIIDVPAGSGALINIDGSFINVSRGIDIKGTGINNILFNFYQATQLTVVAVDIKGSVLAPDADLYFPSGLISGQVVVKSMVGSGQFNNNLFIGDIPCSSEMDNCATVTGLDQVDLNSGNDSDCALISVATDVLGLGNWTLFGSFPEQEIIWTLEGNGAGNIFAGTIGGRIYKTTNGGASWISVQAPTTTNITVLEVTSTGDIYVGTDGGLYYSLDGGSTWNTSPSSPNYVRDIQIDELTGDMYVGTWGFGVYKSTNNGVTWNQINNGLEPFLVVNSVATDGNSHLYAATFGGGIFKSINGGTSWFNTNLGYAFVWDLDVTSNDNVYAATYGGGVFRSTNAGSSWDDITSLLDLYYTYQIGIDQFDNVFVSTWTGGIYKLTGLAPKISFSGSLSSTMWENVGLNGYGVSSLMIDNDSGLLFAGSDKGQIYSTSIITDVDEIVEVPEEYRLDQNYPNPFNPSTTIKVAVAKTGKYSVSVFNVLGEEVASVFDGQLDAGYYDFSFNARNLSSGVYLYSLKGDNVNITRKMILLK
ncbi:MAG: DUF11 domain-containing protein [Melioribacteraceae bacterium]|nr:DUF11 domain-containing protein [Melioribacteraceae bacterium]